MKYLLQIKNLKVEVNNKPIINNLNLSLKQGESLAIVGPNASGKSSLASTIIGLPGYKIKQGMIKFEGKNINRLNPEQRAQLGIGLALQSPPSIQGVTLDSLLGIIASHNDNFGIDIPWGWGDSLFYRDLNVGLSGGEKKISEIIQLAQLNPKLVILDEIDSGLDIQKLNELARIINNNFISPTRSLIIITHRGDILRYLKPDKIAVMVKGKITCLSNNWQEIWKKVKKYGYEKC